MNWTETPSFQELPPFTFNLAVNLQGTRKKARRMSVLAMGSRTRSQKEQRIWEGMRNQSQLHLRLCQTPLPSTLNGMVEYMCAPLIRYDLSNSSEDKGGTAVALPIATESIVVVQVSLVYRLPSVVESSRKKKVDLRWQCIIKFVV